MPAPSIGSGASSTTVGGLLSSIRAQIPDPVPLGQPPSADGNAFSFSILLQWLNDAMRILCTSANVINDWYAIASETGMDVYELPDEIQQVDQLWYDNFPCWRSPELDALFVTKIQGRSYFFGPHSIAATNRLHVWPACDRTAQVTALSANITATDRTIPLASVSAFRPYGFLLIEQELILYRTVNGTPTNTLTQTLRGQGGTLPAAHLSGTTAYEHNIMFRCSKLATPVTGVSDPIGIPTGLVPLLELYVLAKVRQSEQEYQMASQMLQEFDRAVDKLGSKSQLQGLQQGLQVRAGQPGPILYGGRVYIP